MNAYAIVLFVHLCRLIAAFAVSALVHFCEACSGAAETVAELRGWFGTQERIAIVFPVAIVTLVGSGIYMVQAAWAWNTGWIDASLAGVLVLVLNGPMLIGSRARRIQKSLATAGDGAVSPQLARLIRDPLMRSASWANTLLALGIVLVMVMKPALATSTVILVIALVLGVQIAIPLRRTRTRSAAFAE